MNGVFALSETALESEVIKAGFELRLMCLSGYEPILEGCSVCGSAAPDRFNIRQGVTHCAGCTSAEGISMPMDAAVYAAMRHIVFADAKKIFSFRLSADSLLSLCNITEAYLLCQLERSFDTLDFYKSLQFKELNI